MPQSIWKGAISFGLVSIPVRLYSATEEKDISFRQVHRDDGGRIRYKRVCSVDGEEVPYGDIAKGYELPDGEMIVLDDEDFANLPISSSRAVEVLQLRARRAGRRRAAGQGLLLRPDRCRHQALRAAARRAGEGRTRSRSSRWRCASASGSRCCARATAYWCCRPCCGPTRCARRASTSSTKTSRCDRRSSRWPSPTSARCPPTSTPSEYSDHYREALESVIEAKAAGREVKAPVEQAPASGQVVDLMEALRRSVAEAKARRGEAPAQDAAGGGQGEQPGIHEESGRQEDQRRPRSGQEGDEDDQGREEDHGEEDRCAAQRLTITAAAEVRGLESSSSRLDNFSD